MGGINLWKYKYGDYVRTDKGIIDKVIKIEEAGSGTRFFGERLEDTIIITNGDILSERRIDATDIVKHSKDIIDILEDKDFLRIEISEEYVEKQDKEQLLKFGKDITKEELIKDLENGIYKIKSIVTHQSFKQVEYEV